MTPFAAPRLTSENRLALLLHDYTGTPGGKMAYGLLRYGTAKTVVVIDRAHAGEDLRALTNIPAAVGIPIVATVGEALAFGPDVLVPAIAPGGGALPGDWLPDLKEALGAGLSLVNGLHRPLANDPDLAPLVQPGRWIWDIRQEPPGLSPATGAARNVLARRALFVGTDMAVGKMTAALEMDRAARARGVRSRFLATGQIGIAIAGDGMPLDAVRVDFAAGAIEQLVVRHRHEELDLLLIEGQGSLLNPASTATLALLRGSLPTHLVLVHRAGQTTIGRHPWARIPPLPDVVGLYETLASAAGGLPVAPRVVAVALNTAHLPDEAAARCALDEAAGATGLPCTDAVRFGAAPLLDAILTEPRG